MSPRRASETVADGLFRCRRVHHRNDRLDHARAPKRKRPARNDRAGLYLVVGARRFELPTPSTPCRCATRLRYAPTAGAIIARSTVVSQQLPYFLQFLPDFGQVRGAIRFPPKRVRTDGDIERARFVFASRGPLEVGSVRPGGGDVGLESMPRSVDREAL